MEIGENRPWKLERNGDFSRVVDNEGNIILDTQCGPITEGHEYETLLFMVEAVNSFPKAHFSLNRVAAKIDRAIQAYHAECHEEPPRAILLGHVEAHELYEDKPEEYVWSFETTIASYRDIPVFEVTGPLSFVSVL